MILPAGTIKRIHVNQAQLRANTKHGTTAPALTVQTSKGPIRAREVLINGPSKIVDRTGDPLHCGARIWIETTSEVEARS